MLKLLLNSIFVLCLIKFSLSENTMIFPNLPVGEYKVNFKGIIGCTPQPNKIELNIYLSKKSINSTEIKGNITCRVPFDDSLDLEINMAIKDSIGGWKNNAFLYKTPNGCSAFKNFMGNAWTPMMNDLGFKNATCPIMPGIYQSLGADTSFMRDTNLPKSFFYGSYQVRLFFTKNNEVYACIIYILDIVRPWEKI